MALRLLVVDDSLTIRKLVEMSLRGGEYAVEFAASGAEGLEKAAAGVDVLLLDFILPDMKGVDVVKRLSESPATAHVPIIVMTAKSAEVRGQFKPYPAVVDFVTKPFAADDVVARIGKAVSRGEARASEPAPLVHKEAATLVYGRLRAALGRIPEWMRELGDAPAAAFFAKKILTPALVQDIVSGLAPLVGRAVPSAPPVEMRLVGRLQAMPFREVVAMAERADHSGEVRVTLREREVGVYFKGGEIVGASTSDPDHYLLGSGFDPSAVAYEHYARATAEQRGGGKPLFVTLAELGALPLGVVGALLDAQSRRLVGELVDARDGRFAWPETSSLPGWVDAHGRAVSLAGLELARLRDADAAPGEPLALEAVLERESGFSRRIDALGLTAEETRLLAVIDGRSSIAALVEQTGLSPDGARRSLRRLREVGLVRERHAGRRLGPGPVLLWERTAGLFDELELLMRQRPQPLRVRRATTLQETVDALANERSPLCVVDAADAGDEALTLARLVRGSAERVDTRLIALLEWPEEERAQELAAAGFDRVAVKPVHMLELERLMDEPGAARAPTGAS